MNNSNICCICHKKINGDGSSPSPLNLDPNAVCCDACNWAKVFPAKIE